MFSFSLSGRLGDILAPRPEPQSELLSLLRAGQADLAMSLLRKGSFPSLDERDASGLAAIHLACACGAMEVVVELLSMGASVDSLTSAGHTPIHLAALNNRKGIVEVLLRSGADPSVPDGAGCLAAELCTEATVRSLLLREGGSNNRSRVIAVHSSSNGIQNPAQSRDVIQLHQAVPIHDTMQSPSPGSARVQTGSQSDQGSRALSLTVETSVEGTSADTDSAVFGSSSAPASNDKFILHVHSDGGYWDNNSSSHSPSSPISQGSSLPFGLSDVGAAPDQDTTTTAYTLVGVNSEIKRPKVRRPLMSMAAHNLMSFEGSSSHSSNTSNPSSPSSSTPDDFRGMQEGLFPLSSSVPRVPSSSALVPQGQYLPGVFSASSVSIAGNGGAESMYDHSELRNGFDLPVVSPRSSVVSVPPISLGSAPPPALLSRGDNTYLPPSAGVDVSGTGGKSSRRPSLTPISAHAAAAVTSSVVCGVVGAGKVNTDDDLQDGVLNAARATAAALVQQKSATAREKAARMLILRICSLVTVDDTLLRELLTSHPSLANIRFVRSDYNITLSESGRYPPSPLHLPEDIHGFTPLHVAAGCGNARAVALLLDAGASSWDRDLMGRCPLHLAVEWMGWNSADEMGSVADQRVLDVCSMLKESMQQEKGVDPVGEHAPLDLVGNTPLGCRGTTKTTSPLRLQVPQLLQPPSQTPFFSAAKQGPAGAVTASLLACGDRCLLPRTPLALRTGKSPWRPPGNADRDNVMHACSEARGWSDVVHDFTSVMCPVVGRPAWSLFTMFSAKNGNSCAALASEQFGSLLAVEADRRARQRGSIASVPGGLVADAGTNAELLESILLRSAQAIDVWLSTQSLLRVHEVAVDPSSDDVVQQLLLDDLSVRRDESFTVTPSTMHVSLSQSSCSMFACLISPEYISICVVGGCENRALLAQRPENQHRNSFGVGAAILNPFGAPQPVPLVGSSSAFTSGIGSFHSSPTTLPPPLSIVPSDADCSPCPSPHSRPLVSSSLFAATRQRVSSAGGSLDRIDESGDVDTDDGESSSFQTRAVACRNCFGDFPAKFAAGVHPSQLSSAPQQSPRDEGSQAESSVNTNTFSFRRTTRDAFIVIMSETVMEIMNEDEIVMFFAQKLGFTVFGGPVGGIGLSVAADACDSLLLECLCRGCKDSLAVILVILGPPVEHTRRDSSPSQQLLSVERSVQDISGTNGRPSRRNTPSAATLQQYLQSSNLGANQMSAGSTLTMGGLGGVRSTQRRNTPGSVTLQAYIDASNLGDYSSTSISDISIGDGPTEYSRSSSLLQHSNASASPTQRGSTYSNGGSADSSSLFAATTPTGPDLELTTPTQGCNSALRSIFHTVPDETPHNFPPRNLFHE